ncbi:MAG: hypothetical protein ACI4QY_04430 [Oscillospiraceae bacterium]
MKRFISIILTIAVGFSVLCAENIGGFSVFCAFAATSVLTEENITLEYSATDYSGLPQSPKITVTVGDTVLTLNTDYTVKYPSDRTNAGEKEIMLSGIGEYSGEVKLGYTITPLDCTNNEAVTVEAGDCYYNGLPQYPEVTVKVGGVVVPQSNYTLSLSDNTEVSGSTQAKCVVKFRNNLSGERTVNFNILRGKHFDYEIDLAVNAGQSVSIDLSSLKPSGAVFGNHVYESDAFLPNDRPKIAFNQLTFTLNPEYRGCAYVAVPLTNIPNIEDYWLEFYIDVVDKEFPALSLNPIVKEYDGKPVSAEELAKNGSVAYIDGEEISGVWSFTTPVPTNPCEKEIAVVKFTPDDAQYSYAYGLVQITVSRIKAEDFGISANYSKLALGETLRLTVEGIPDDFDGRISITDSCEDGFSVLGETETENGREYLLEFAEENAYHTLKVTLGGSARYAPRTEELTITVGNPPEQETDSATTEEQLAKLIEEAASGSTVIANKTKSVSASLLRAAAAKKLTIEVKASDSLSLVIEPAKMKSITTLTTALSGAVIPQVLLDRTGDEPIASFTVFTGNTGGVSIKATANPELDLPISCLYFYNTNGELQHIESVMISGKTVKFALPASGKYVITESRISHIRRDFTNDCMIDFDDIYKLFDMMMKLPSNPSEEQLAAMDMNGDGYIDFDDLQEILDYAVSH